MNKVREHIQNLQKLQTKIKQDQGNPSNKKVIRCIKRKKKDLTNRPPFVVRGVSNLGPYDNTKSTHRNTNSGI